MPKIIFKKLTIKQLDDAKAGHDLNQMPIGISTPTQDDPDCDTVCSPKEYGPGCEHTPDIINCCISHYIIDKQKDAIY